jgi:hypothetical protein
MKSPRIPAAATTACLTREVAARGQFCSSNFMLLKNQIVGKKLSLTPGYYIRVYITVVRYSLQPQIVMGRNISSRDVLAIITEYPF